MTPKEEGYNYQGPKHLCPYHIGSPEYNEWMQGWEARYYGEPL